LLTLTHKLPTPWVLRGTSNHDENMWVLSTRRNLPPFCNFLRRNVWVLCADADGCCSICSIFSCCASMLYNRSFCDNYVSYERALALLSPELFQPKMHRMSSGGQAPSGPTREPNHSPSPCSRGQRGMEREERGKGRGEERGEEGKKGMERDAHTRKYATVCAYALTLCCALLKTALFYRA